MYTTLGTVSASATPLRGVSCGLLRLPGSGSYLFDAGEGSVGRLRDCYLTSTTALTRIFITHLHGDHVLGLPAVLYQWLSSRYGGPSEDACGGASTSASADAQRVRRLEIFGPVGLLELVRAAFPTLSTRARAELPLDIIEVVPGPADASHSSGDGSGNARFSMNARPQPAAARAAIHSSSPLGHYRLLLADADGVLRLVDDSEHSVVAAPVKHSTTCLGYVVTGKRRRHLLPDKLRERGLPPGVAYRHLVETGTATAPDGSTVRLEDVSYLGPPGFKFALLGDNCGAPPIMTDIADGADLLVHEATVVSGSRAEALAKAHSTPAMAGAFARDARAQRLLLTHFSPTFALRDAVCSVHALGEERISRALRSAAATAVAPATLPPLPSASAAAAMGRDVRWLADAAAALDVAASAEAGPLANGVGGARDWLERSSGFSPQPRMLAAGLFETRRYADDGGAAPRGAALSPVTTTVDANVRDLLRWSSTRGSLAIRRLWAFSHPDVRDHPAAAAVASAAQDAFGSERVLCARDFLAVVVPTRGRESSADSVTQTQVNDQARKHTAAPQKGRSSSSAAA